MKPLVVVDSEAKAKTLAAQADVDMDRIVVRTAPMVVDHDPAVKDIHKGEEGFQFRPSQSGKDLIERLQGDFDRDVILAFDNDQRGDYWGWMLNGYFASSCEGKTCKRLRARGLSRDAIKESWGNIEHVIRPDGASFYARSLFNGYLIRHLKRLLGTSAGPANLPLDYTTLTILFLLADRKNMVSSAAAEIMSKFRVKLVGGSGEFIVTLREGNGVSKDGLIAAPEQVKSILAELSANSFVVENIKRRPWVVTHPTPQKLAKIFHDAHCLLKMPPKAVWLTLLKLYHGVEIDGVSTGLISDPYNGIPENSEVTARIREFLGRIHGQNEVIAREIDPKAILPLHPKLPGDKLQAVLKEDEIRLYEMIRSRALMSQMTEAEGEEIEVIVRAGDFVLRGLGLDVKEQGFLKEDKHEFKDLLQPTFSQLKAGEELALGEIFPQHVAGPSSGQYTLTSLIDDLVEFSIPLSSRLPILFQGMLEKNYIKMLTDGTVICLENTKKVVDAVNKIFPRMQGINLSAYYEQTVAEVISGRKDINFALKQFDQNFQIHGAPLVKKTASAPVIPRTQRSKNIIKGSIDDPSDVKVASPSTQQQGLEFAEAQEEQAPVPDTDKAVESSNKAEMPSELGTHTDKELQQEKREQVDSDIGRSSEHLDTAPEIEEMEKGTDRAEGEGEIANHDITHEKQCIDEIGDFEPSDPQQASPEEQSSLPGGEVEDKKILGISTDSENVDDVQKPQENKVEIPCPFCDNDFLVKQNTPAGKVYYECSVSNCEFIAWARPHGITCLKCKSPYLVEKQQEEVTHLQCPKAGCDYEQPLMEDDKKNQSEKGDPGEKKKKVLVRRKKGGAVSGSKKRKVVVRRKRV